MKTLYILFWQGPLSIIITILVLMNMGAVASGPHGAPQALRRMLLVLAILAISGILSLLSSIIIVIGQFLTQNRFSLQAKFIIFYWYTGILLFCIMYLSAFPNGNPFDPLCLWLFLVFSLGWYYFFWKLSCHMKNSHHLPDQNIISNKPKDLNEKTKGSDSSNKFMPKFPCRSCKEDIPFGASECPNCGWSFREDRENRISNKKDFPNSASASQEF